MLLRFLPRTTLENGVEAGQYASVARRRFLSESRVEQCRFRSRPCFPCQPGTSRSLAHARPTAYPPRSSLQCSIGPAGRASAPCAARRACAHVQPINGRGPVGSSRAETAADSRTLEQPARHAPPDSAHDMLAPPVDAISACPPTSPGTAVGYGDRGLRRVDVDISGRCQPIPVQPAREGSSVQSPVSR